MEGNDADMNFRSVLKKELVRKILHVLIAFLPLIAWHSRPLAFILLLSGIMLYGTVEALRNRWNGNLHSLPYRLITAISIYTSRPGEVESFIKAPLTLAGGAGLALLLFPGKASTAGILVLAFADTAATLVGKIWYRKRDLFRSRKSLPGTVACLIVSFSIVMLVLNDPVIALAAALTATVCEMVTLRDFDNLLIPMGVAAVITLM